MKHLYLLKAIISSNEKMPIYAEHSMMVESGDELEKEKILQCYNCAVAQFKRMRGLYPFVARCHSDDWFDRNVGKKFFADIYSISATGHCIDTKYIYGMLYNMGYTGDLSDRGYSYLAGLSLIDRIEFVNRISSATKVEYDIRGNKLGVYYRINSNYDEWLKYDGVQSYQEGTKLIHNGNGLKCTVLKYYEPFTIIGWDSRCCKVYYPELDQYSYEDVTNFTKEE